MTDKQRKILETAFKKSGALRVLTGSSKHINPIRRVEKKQNVQLEKNNSHLAGEYFVAAELYRRGFSIGMTIGNAKAIDLFAYKDNVTVPVQVKAIRNKKSVGWPITKNIFFDNVVYVFVNLNDYGTPEYFILTGKEARENFKQYNTRGIINLTPLRKEAYQERWDKLADAVAGVNSNLNRKKK